MTKFSNESITFLEKVCTSVTTNLLIFHMEIETPYTCITYILHMQQTMAQCISIWLTLCQDWYVIFLQIPTRHLKSSLNYITSSDQVKSIIISVTNLKKGIRGCTQTTMTGFWLFFEHLPPCVDIYYGMNVDKKGTFLDHLPISSCKSSLWMTLRICTVCTQNSLHILKAASNIS